jgi:hypothetical protein
MILTGETEVLGEKPVLVPLCLTWTDLESNPGLRDDRPATDRLSHCTAFVKA